MATMKQERRRMMWSTMTVPILVGVVTVGLFFGIFGAWAVTAPLSGAAIASGTVSPENSRRTVQHLEGGVIREIRVRDGARVEEGQVLVILDDTKARAQLESQQVIVESLQARKERLEYELRLYADKQSQGELVFSDRLIAEAADSPTTQMLMEMEKARFISRMAALRSAQGVLQQTIDGYKVEIAGLENELRAVQAQLDLQNRQNDLFQGLREKGLEVESKVIETLRAVAQSEQLKAERISRIDKLKESIKSAELQKEDAWLAKIDEVTSEIAAVQEDILTGLNSIETYRDTVERTVIKSPVKGTLIDLKINTVGAVVQSGATVVEIVPTEEALTLELKIDPQDIDVVRVGQPAQVTLVAYPQRSLPKLHSTLESVSADALTDTHSGESYYLGKMRITEDELRRLGDDIRMLPGMPVQVMIETSKRTFAQYLISPILDSADRAFRE